MARHRYIGTEDRELIDARGRRVVVSSGDIADLPDYTAPQAALWEAVDEAPAPAAEPARTIRTTKEKGGK